MPPRLRPAPIEPVIDGKSLREALTSAAIEARDEADRRRWALEILKRTLDRGRETARARLEAGAGGIETAQLLARVTDEIVTALYDFVTVHVFRARNPTQGERLSVAAVGGYGRGALAPFSDIDLLFLRPYKPTAHTESVIEYMLYALWDLGFKVGHASRTIDECLKFAREDFTIRTALLEARWLAGDKTLVSELKRRFRKEVAEGTGAPFVAAKLAERDARHARSGASRYMVEPNVKEGKGGLRDLNTLFWIAQYLHPSEAPAEVVNLDEFTGRELRAFMRASDFLWAVRAHLHFLTGRAEERLTFDLQPEIARRMGYVDHGEEPAVERFMRRYFLIAREVGALTRTFCAKLEAEHAKKPQGLSRLLPVRRKPKRRPLESGFHEEGGRLTVDGPEVFEQDPVNLLRLFALADRLDLDLHPDAFAAANRSLNLISAKLRRDRHAARLFLDILARGRQTQRTLGLMNESGVLGRYLPEFGRVVGQMQFNMYHAYTVDEHTLRAIGVIADVLRGRLCDDHPLCCSVAPLISDREALYLAMLLHDTGKGGEGGQELAGARSARLACERLGLAPERIDLVAWLVENHLVMSDYAQKRDLGDPATIEAFAQIVQNPDRLRLLLILTVADIRAVGPGVWNGWKGELMRQLYAATEAVFRGGREADTVARPEVDRSTAAAASGAEGAFRRWAEEMEDAYFATFRPELQAAHFQLVRRAADQSGAAASARLREDLNATEIVVAAKDRLGLFADLAGALARLGANIVGARLYTSRGGQALDVFYAQDSTGAPFGRDDPRAFARVAEAMEAAARGEATRPEARRLDLGRAAAFSVSPSVAVDNDTSSSATVVEVSGRDRPGLLEALARAIAEAGLSVQSAHVENYGERAVDAFYVTDAGGAKLTNAARIAALKQGLLTVLQNTDSQPGRGRPRLQQARASVAR